MQIQGGYDIMYNTNTGKIVDNISSEGTCVHKMKETSLQIVQYQGSKRKLAHKILKYMPLTFDRLIEPFSGMAAISIAVALENRTNNFYINDLNAPLINLLQSIIDNPELVIQQYTELWNEQFFYGDNHTQHYFDVRDRFNRGEDCIQGLLYLLARCVKGAVRYSKGGNFNQSPDKRRHGTKPETMAKNIRCVSKLLKGKTTFSALDYRDVFELAQSGDLVYMDPPYQGVSNVRDNRYLAGVSFDEFADALQLLNQKHVDYLISYDGECGGKVYGEELPSSLKCKKILLDAGTSAQATLLGKSSTTFEALYISEGLALQFRPILELEQSSQWEAVNS